MRARDNVLIVLCDDDGCFSHPLRECEHNERFHRRLEGWRQRADHVLIWDYYVNYSSYLMPAPNLRRIQEDIRLYRELGVEGMFCQGSAVRGGQLATLQRFAEEMASVLREMPLRPLLVISTDMNHFANDTETRRLDRMALDCLEALDPPRLYETVVDNQISMCGMVPAVLVLETLRRLDGLKRCESVGYATSADALGNTREVVGYAGMLFD